MNGKLIDWYIEWFAYRMISTLIVWYLKWLICWFIGMSIDWHVRKMMSWCTDWVGWWIVWFACWLILICVNRAWLHGMILYTYRPTLFPNGEVLVTPVDVMVLQDIKASASNSIYKKTCWFTLNLRHHHHLDQPATADEWLSASVLLVLYRDFLHANTF